MSRPIKRRSSCCSPDHICFKPCGKHISTIEKVTILPEEFEAIKHKYLEGMDQQQVAERLNISQSTFHRILYSANRKMADAIVNGKSITIGSI